MSKQKLLQDRSVIPEDKPEELCAHLDPVLKYLEAQGARIERRDTNFPNWRLVVVLDTFFYKDDMFAAFDIPDFIEWSYADPHYATGNSLNCHVCRKSIEGRFDFSDPKRTLGP